MTFDGDLEEIRNKIDIVELISESVALKRAGRNFKGLCPFHPEKTPSFTVNPERQIFHCFGCGAGGDAFGFIMRREDLSFPEAKRALAGRAGVKLRESAGAGRWRGERETLRAMQKEALNYFREGLKASPPALKYLAGRGVSEESAKAFGIGYAPDSWHGLYNRLKSFAKEEPLLMRSGLLAAGKRGPYDIFRGRLMFPIFDISGEPIAFGGRTMGEADAQKGQPKYLNSPDSPLFSKRETLYALNAAKGNISAEGRAVVVEGYMDVVICHQAGINTAIAPLGTALTEGHLKRISRYASSLLLVFDGDRAGVSAARRSLSLIADAGMRAEVLMLPEGEDPDSLIRGGGAKALSALMKQALSPVGFILKTNASGGIDAAKEAAALISRVPEPLLRDAMIAELADSTGTRELTIREELRRIKGGGGPVPTAPGRGAAAKGRRAFSYNEETLLLSAALAEPQRVKAILKSIELKDLRDPAVRNIMERLEGAASALEAARAPEEEALISRLCLEPGFEPDDIGAVMEDCIGKIRSRQMKETVKKIDEDIKAAERASDIKLLNSLLKERQRLARGTK